MDKKKLPQDNQQSLARRLMYQKATDADKACLSNLANPPPKVTTISDWYHALLSGENAVRISKYQMYVEQDLTARLIEDRYGAWPKDDPGVVKRAVRRVAKHTKQSSDTVWRMEFADFRTALADTILCERLGGPPTPMQRAIWRALDGRARKTDALEGEVAGGDRARLYYTNRKTKKGGLHEMKEVGIVALKRTVGYYRPDAPPTTN